MATSGSTYGTGLQRYTPGGYDISFVMPALTNGQTCGVTCAAYILKETANYSGDECTFIGFIRHTNDLDAVVYTYSVNSGTPNKHELERIRVGEYGDGQSAHDVRIVWHGNFASLYLDFRWVMTFHFYTIDWGTQRHVWVETWGGTGSVTITDVVSHELFAWREAVFTDLETVGTSALSNVIQERPLEIYPQYNGDLSFSLNLYADIVVLSAAQIIQHSRKKQSAPQSGSDAIIYYTNVLAIHNVEYEEEFGFATRVLRLSNLDEDAELVARATFLRAFQASTQHRLTTRPDLRIELGDVLWVDYTTSSTSRHEMFAFVAENIQIKVNESTANMIITGREIPYA